MLETYDAIVNLLWTRCNLVTLAGSICVSLAQRAWCSFDVYVGFCIPAVLIAGIPSSGRVYRAPSRPIISPGETRRTSLDGRSTTLETNTPNRPEDNGSDRPPVICRPFAVAEINLKILLVACA